MRKPSIGNPASFFINGSETREFTFKGGGSTLYHFSPHDNDLSSSMEMNLIFFADSELHGLDILKAMYRFAIRCAKRYLQAKGDNDADQSIL